MAWGIGFLGAGAAVQSIHLPTLARLPGEVRVTAVMDVDAARAAMVAGRVGARATTSVAEVLADPDVDIVAVCSPEDLHADQVAAALHAGKAVLCEKPFVTTRAQADLMQQALAATSAPVVVGAMHLADPAWAEVRDRFAAPGATLLRSTIMLPPNSVFEDLATEVIARDPAADAEFLASRTPETTVAGCLLGLAVHDLPLIRLAVPTVDRVDAAIALAPYGYALTLGGGAATVCLTAHFHAHPTVEWTLQRWTGSDVMTIAFPPSYVHAGSATVSIREGGVETVTGPYPTDGYLQQWRHLIGLMRTGQDRAERVEILADTRYLLRIVELTAVAEGKNL